MRRIVIIVLCAIWWATEASGANVVTRAVVGSGVVVGASLHHATQGTIGQSLAGESASGTIVLRAGFWLPAVPAPGDVEPSRLPTTYALYSATPNPFTEDCALRYDVPAGGGRVDLVIFDVRGRLVRALVRGPQVPGSKSVRWNGRDDAGRAVGFGLYFVMLEAPGYRSVEKVLRIR